MMCIYLMLQKKTLLLIVSAAQLALLRHIVHSAQLGMCGTSYHGMVVSEWAMGNSGRAWFATCVSTVPSVRQLLFFTLFVKLGGVQEATESLYGVCHFQNTIL